MIKTLSSTDELAIILRKELISQSGIDDSLVRNVESKFGTELSEFTDNDIVKGLNFNNVMILFDLDDRQNDSDVSQTQSDDSIIYYKSYILRVIIYGKNSNDLSTNLVARFRTQIERTRLQDKGIYIEEVSNPTELNEFYNNILWERHDFDISIRCAIKVLPVIEDYTITNLNSINIKQST